MTTSRWWLMCILLAAQVCSAQDRALDLHHEDAQIQETVREVLANPEYRHLLRKPVESTTKDNRTPDWLRRFLEWLFGTDSSGSSANDPTADFGEVLFYVVIVILVLLAIVVLVSVLKKSVVSSYETPLINLDEEAITPSLPPGDQPANVYEQRALAAAESGDYRSALRELVRGSMSWTERAGLIRYRQGLTNRDYIRAVWRFAPRRDSLMQIVAEFEKVFYGRRVADVNVFNNCLQAFRDSFSKETNDASLAT